MIESRASLLCEYIKTLSLSYDSINIFETGTIRNITDEYAMGDGHSTRHICNFIKNQNTFKKINYTSVDLNIDVCDKFLTELGLRECVTLIQSDSREAIKNIDYPLHFVHLDSANDADLILEEFKLVVDKVQPKGLIIVDDVMMNNPHVVKGHKVIPYAQKEGYEVFLSARQGIIRV